MILHSPKQMCIIEQKYRVIAEYNILFFRKFCTLFMQLQSSDFLTLIGAAFNCIQSTAKRSIFQRKIVSFYPLVFTIL